MLRRQEEKLLFLVRNRGNKKEQVMQEQDKEIHHFGEKVVLYLALNQEIIIKKCQNKKGNLL